MINFIRITDYFEDRIQVENWKFKLSQFREIVKTIIPLTSRKFFLPSGSSFKLNVVRLNLQFPSIKVMQKIGRNVEVLPQDSKVGQTS